MPLQQDISVDELANRLGLTVIECNTSLARLGNNSTAVTIFAKPGGSVYVNGSEIATAADITSTGRTLMLPAGLENEIRLSLRIAPATPISPPPPPRAKPVPKPRPICKLGVVIIDPGHGGKDSGAISAAGHYEKHVVLAVSRAIAQLLRDDNVKVHMTRDSDVFVKLSNRAGFCNRLQPDLFVSIHADAARNRKARGFTVFVPRRETKGSCSHRAGRYIVGKMRAFAASRGVRQHEKNLRVLEKTSCPAMLVELGFMSNSTEAALLIRRDYQRRLAEAIADAIILYLRKK